MPKRRTVLGAIGAAIGTTTLGLGTARTSSDRGPSEANRGGGQHSMASDSAVAYVRNVEEVRGHLTSSATLLAEERREDALLHANHGSDYFGSVLPRLRDEDPELASRLRGRLLAVPEQVETTDAETYRAFLTEDVFPLLTEAVATVVPAAERDTDAFDARVANALAGRIAEEYNAAVTPDGDIELSGEYWDGRGFLTRIEERLDAAGGAFGSETTDALSTLRSQMEAIEPPAAVSESTIRFRVAATVAADLPAATVESREAAVGYVRAADEARGHAYAAQELLEYGDTVSGSLHAGHGADYVLSLIPALRGVDRSLADSLLDDLLAVDQRFESSDADEFDQFVTETLTPELDDAVAAVVPDEFPGSVGFQADATTALLDRIEEEYAAAVTDEEVIELYGEYWDSRGFFLRVRERYDEMSGDLSEGTRESVEPELDILEEELRTARPPWDVANSVAALTEDLGAVSDE